MHFDTCYLLVLKLWDFGRKVLLPWWPNCAAAVVRGTKTVSAGFLALKVEGGAPDPGKLPQGIPWFHDFREDTWNMFGFFLGAIAGETGWSETWQILSMTALFLSSHFNGTCLFMFVHVCSDYISNDILYVYFAYNTIILLYFISNYFLTWNDMVNLQWFLKAFLALLRHAIPDFDSNLYTVLVNHNTICASGEN